MNIPTEFVMFGVVQLTVVIIAFTTVKNDTVWIKRRLAAGDRRLNIHSKILSRQHSDISVIKSMCTVHHGTQFPDESEGISNGGENSDD